MFFRFILLVVALLVVSLPVHAMVGGWSNADPKSPEVLKAANFAVDTKFPGEHPHFKITEAKKQVFLNISFSLLMPILIQCIVPSQLFRSLQE